MLKTFDYQNTPIVDVVNEILVDSAKRGASDIHLDPREKYLLIRIRIDGELIDYAEVPYSIRDYLITRIKTIAKMNITETRRPQDGAIKTTLSGIDLDLRVSSLPVSGGEKVVIRILDYSLSMAGLNELGFTEENYKKLLEMISVPNGIILVTGATGSGKSTTVYSILEYLNKPTTNIITVEDPIEMDIEGVNQVQVNSGIGLTFASALRSILRQDPNIIMIGEIRDSETAKIAVRASVTGHLVLSTVHTNNSLNTIERLIDMDVARYLLAASLEGIISQKLARRLCNHCKKKRATTNYEKEIFRIVLGKEIGEIYDIVGCEYCHDGFTGRIPIQEVLKINQNIRDALSNNVSKEELREMVYGSGVSTLLEDGLNKVLNGITSFNEIMTLIELDDESKFSGNTTFLNAMHQTRKNIKEDITNIPQNSMQNTVPANTITVNGMPVPEATAPVNYGGTISQNIMPANTMTVNGMPVPEATIPVNYNGVMPQNSMQNTVPTMINSIPVPQNTAPVNYSEVMPQNNIQTQNAYNMPVNNQNVT